MDRVYLQEAFRSMELLEEEDFRLDDVGVKDIIDFYDNDEENQDIDVFDDEAEDEEGLKDSYIGSVILECEVCHSPIFKNVEDVVVDEESDLANIEDECPICHSQDGFKIIGQVAPYQEDAELKVEVEDKPEDEDTEDDIEDESADDEEEEVEESLNETKSTGKYKMKDTMYPNKSHPGKKCKECDKESEPKEVEESLEEDLDPELEEKIDEVEEKIEEVAETVEAVADEVCEGECEAEEEAEMDAEADEVDDSEIPEEDELEEIEVEESLNEEAENKDEDDDLVSEPGNPLGKFDGEDGEKKRNKYIDKKIDVLKDFGCFASKYHNDEKEIRAKLADMKSETAIDNYCKTIMDKCNESLEPVREGFEKVDLEMEDKIIHVSEEEKEPVPDAEMITPVSDELEAELTAPVEDEGAEEMPAEDVPMEEVPEEPVAEEEPEFDEEEDFGESLEQETTQEVVNEDCCGKCDKCEDEEEMVDYEVDDFNEDEFDKLGESYLKNVYDNVSSFKTASVSQEGEKLVVEGVITFNSGKEKSTKFIFEAKDATKSGKVRFVGENAQISRGKKSFTLAGTINEGKFIAESLNYNYRVDSNRVYGTVRVDD